MGDVVMDVVSTSSVVYAISDMKVSTFSVPIMSMSEEE